MTTNKTTYKPGERVYIQFPDSDVQGPYTVKSCWSNAVMNMVSFEEKEFSVGVCYVKSAPEDQNGKLVDYLHGADSYAVQNIFEEGFNPDNRSLTQMEGVRNYAGKPELLFFRPDYEMIKWLAEYAAGRMVIDCGCGSARLTEALADQGVRIIGLDPFLNMDNVIAMTEARINRGKAHIHLLNRKIEQMPGLFVGQGNKVLLLFARPCHSSFVYDALKMKDADTEALYITVPKNLEKYNDLGEFQNNAKEVKPRGRSGDNEVFYSIY